MAQSLIDILLRFRRQGQGEVQGAVADLKSLDNAAGMLSQGLAGLAAGAGVAGIVALTRELDNLARRGAVFEQLGTVLDSFAASAGTNAQAMIDAAQKAAAGTISQYELILNANRALQFEVAKTPEQFAKLVELSTALGRAQGISDTQALEYITTGLARESRLILDNLGLIIDVEQATKNYASTVGKSADQLTTAERKQALLNEAFKQGATAIEANRDAADSAATRFERWDTTVTNFNDTFGRLLALAASDKIAALTLVIEALNKQLSEEGTTGGVETKLERLFELKRQLESGQAFDVAGVGRIMTANEEAIENVNVALREQVNAYREAATAGGTMQQAADLSLQAGDAFTVQANAARDAAAALAETEAAAAATGRAAALAAIDAGALTDELNKLAQTSASAIVGAAKGVVGIVGSEKAKELANQQLRYLQEQTLELQKQGVTGLDLTFAYEDIKNQSLAIFENIEEADRAAQRAAAGGVSAMKKAAQEAEREFESLKSKVAGVLSGALDPGVGVDVNSLLKTGVKVPEGQQPKPEDLLLPREDAINEEARRLADIAVKGFESPWLEYFKNQWPDLYEEMFANAQSNDSVRKTAALLLKNFQDGLNPELIDKDAAKERVRRMLLGEARMEELATEIASELAGEFGNVGASKLQDLATRALGGGATGLLGAPDRQQIAEQYGGVGATAAEAFGSGARGAVTDGNLGNQVINAMDEQLRAESNLARLTESGRLSGSAWGSGFLEVAGDNIPARLIDILAQLVTPAVDALLLQRQTLQGAR